jgi:hypothetical protein
LRAGRAVDRADEARPYHRACEGDRISERSSDCILGDAVPLSSAVSVGPNKKTAEQKAALLALEELGVFEAKEVDQAFKGIASEEPS